MKQHLQRRCLHGFPGTEEHSRELAKPRPSHRVRRHPRAVRPASATLCVTPFETWWYVSIHYTCARRHCRSDARLGVLQSLFAVVLLPLSKTACSCW